MDEYPATDLASDPASVRIEYYAVFRARAGKGGEEVALGSGDPAGLYEALRSRYRFPLDRDIVRLAVNDVFAPWTTRLHPGDRVVFVPPVSGG
jgi:molybdopterin converting factor small subunit